MSGYRKRSRTSFKPAVEYPVNSCPRSRFHQGILHRPSYFINTPVPAYQDILTLGLRLACSGVRFHDPGASPSNTGKLGAPGLWVALDVPPLASEFCWSLAVGKGVIGWYSPGLLLSYTAVAPHRIGHSGCLVVDGEG